MTDNKLMAVQLGMPQGTASNKLKKMLLFDMAQRLDEDTCYRCGVKILNIDEFSIDHKTNWLHSGKAVELFFDIHNIAFSHRFCNILAANKKGPNKGGKNLAAQKKIIDGNLWCASGNHYVPINLFGKDHRTFLGYMSICKICRNNKRKERYAQGLSR